MKIYISGAITNNPNFKEDFAKVEEYLKNLKYKVINPTMIELPDCCGHDDYMKVCFALLDIADGIYMMDGWRNSCGACQEYGYAFAKRKIILFERN